MNPKQKSALEYLNQYNWSVFPVNKDKQPVLDWKQFQTRKPTEEEVMNWFKNESYQIAVVTGQISEGLIIVDVDKNKITGNFHPKALEVFENYKNQTLTAQSGSGGYHLYFKATNPDIKNKASGEFNFDIRANGGYVVAPPSDNNQGHYFWLSKLPIADFPQEIMGLFGQSGETQSIEKISTLPSEILMGVPNGSRNDILSRLCGKLTHHLPEKDWPEWGLGLARLWNNNLTEPLPENEVLRTFENIAQIERLSGSQNRYKPKITLSIAELYKKPFPEPIWLIDELIAKNTITALSGPPGCGKTWLSLEMARAISSGRMFLGHFLTKKANVLIVDEESGEARLKDRVKKMDIEAELPIYFYCRSGFKLDNKEAIEDLLASIKRFEIDLVIFDSFVRIHCAKENDATEISNVIEVMKTLTDKGVTVIFIHHHRKESNSSSFNGQAMRGSSDILAGVDCHLIVKKDGRRLVVAQSKLRDAEEIEPFMVDWNTEGQKISFTYAGGQKRKLSNSELISQRIEQALLGNPDGLTKGEIYEQVGFNERTVMPILQSKIDQGEVVTQKLKANTILCQLLNQDNKKGGLSESKK